MNHLQWIDAMQTAREDRISALLVEIERLRQQWAEVCKDYGELRAERDELLAALEDAIDTLEAMDLHDSPLYGRLRAALAKEEG